jgi:hypothetical protein
MRRETAEFGVRRFTAAFIFRRGTPNETKAAVKRRTPRMA